MILLFPLGTGPNSDTVLGSQGSILCSTAAHLQRSSGMNARMRKWPDIEEAYTTVILLITSV